MSAARLTSRQVAVGQLASPSFRRVFSPVSCAANERFNRSRRSTLTRLRDSSKLKNILVVTRSDSSAGERETHSDSAALVREKQESVAQESNEGQSVTVFPAKTFNSGDPSDVTSSTENTEMPTSENRPSDQEKVESRSGDDSQIISRTADVIVAKKLSKSSLSKPQSMKRTDESSQPVPKDPAPQNAPSPKSSVAQKSAADIAASKSTIIKRVEDVLVVQKSSTSSTASQQLPSQIPPNGKAGAMEGKHPSTTEKTLAQPSVTSMEANKSATTKPEVGRVIERPRPKKSMSRPPSKQTELSKAKRPEKREPIKSAQVLLIRRTRLALEDEQQSPLIAQLQQNRQTHAASLEKGTGGNVGKIGGNQDSVKQNSDLKQSSDNTKNVKQIRSTLLKNAHMLTDDKIRPRKAKVTSNLQQVDQTDPPSVTEPQKQQTEQSPKSEEQSPKSEEQPQSVESSSQKAQAPVERKKVQLVKAPTRPTRLTRPIMPSKKSKPSTKPSAKKVERRRPGDLDFDRQFLQQKAMKAKEDQRRAVQERLEREQARELEREARYLERMEANDFDSHRKGRLDRQETRNLSDDAEREMIIEVGAEGLSVEELASLLAIDSSEVMRVLFVKGVLVAVNQTLDTESVKVVANEMGVEVLDKTEEDVTEMAKKEESFCEDDDQSAINRPPVVTVMGHVDHGKTSLLDYIRRTRVVEGEAGGITQAIGAYTCEIEADGEKRSICFLDTPGHEAFSAMRARGTRVTDIAIIVIAANDGIRPQTLEAISHAKAAEVPIIIAINKIDMVGADPERVKRELSEIELLPEEWGGKTPVVCISAKKGDNVQDLLEMITLVSDIQLDLRANPDALAKGTVIEAFLDKRSGVVATVLVQNGTLHVGDAVVAGAACGKVRCLTNERNRTVNDVGPSAAVQMMGFSEIPTAGDIFAVCSDETEAKAEAEKAADAVRNKHLLESAGGGSMVTLSSLASVDDEDANALQRLNLVLKGDTSGSIEAVKGALAKLPQEAVMIRYLHVSPGAITESDILLAAAAEGMIVGFNAIIREEVKAIAKQKGVQIQNYSVIYDLIDDVRAIMEGRLSPTEDELPIGSAEIRAVFGTGSRRVAGCMVTEGRLNKGCSIKVFRKKKVIFEGTLTSLRRVKDKVDEVSAGSECGVGCDDYSEWLEGDQIEAFTVVQKRLTLEESRATMAVIESELQELDG